MYMVIYQDSFFGVSDRTQKYLVKRMTEFLNYIGREPGYLLYGTDWPISDMGVYLNFLQKIELNTRDRDLIMSKNAKMLFGI